LTWVLKLVVLPVRTTEGVLDWAVEVVEFAAVEVEGVTVVDLEAVREPAELFTVAERLAVSDAPVAVLVELAVPVEAVPVVLLADVVLVIVVRVWFATTMPVSEEYCA
jgi:hypothetical protein